MGQFKGGGLEKEAPLEFYKGAWLNLPALGQHRGGVPMNQQSKIFPTEVRQTLQHLQGRAGEVQKSRLRVRQCPGEDQTSRRLPFPSDEDLGSHQVIADPSGEVLQNLHPHKWRGEAPRIRGW